MLWKGFRMRRLSWFCLVTLLLIRHGLAGAENITVSLVTPSAAYMDHLVAVEKGYFASKISTSNTSARAAEWRRRR